MKRITSIQKEVLLKLNKILKYDLDKITYNKINKIYKNINKILRDNHMEVYDFNMILKEYKVNNNLKNIVDKLKQLIRVRNNYILKKASKSVRWKKCIMGLCDKYKNKFNNKKIDIFVEKSLLDLLKRYKNNWLGYWKIIELDNNNNIKDINIFDKKDKDLFLKRLKINLKK
jgi:hypothetical protein